MDISLADGVPKWESSLALRFPLSRSTTRRNVDRTYREKVERKEGEETLLLPSYSLAAYVALSKCLPLGG